MRREAPHHLKGVALPRPQLTAQLAERSSGIAPVDGVSEVPRGTGPGRAKERLQLLHSNP